MFSDGISLLFALMMLMGGGPSGSSDLLDMVPTDSYWRAKEVTVTVEQLERDAGVEKTPENVEALIKALGSDDFKTRNDAKAKLEAMGPAISAQLKPATESKDPEVAAVATSLLKKFSDGARAREIRRLMAIRTLGERKEKGALPLLKELTASKELFVADYAERAIGKIEGKAVVRVNHQKELQGDLKVLPRDTGIVLQAVGIGGAEFTLEKAIDQMASAPNAPMFGGGGGKAPDKQKMLAKVTKEILKVLESTGNIRVDGLTLGVAKDIGPKGGWMVVSIRGKYDAAAAMMAMKGQDEQAKLTHEGKVDILDMDSDTTTVLFPSNDQLVICEGMGAPLREGMVKEMVAVLNGGKGNFGENAEMAALMKTVDTTLPVWGAVLVNKDMQKEKMFEAYDTITLGAKQEKEGLSFVFTGQGTDVEKVKASADEMTGAIQMQIGQLKPMAAQMKPLQALVDVLESLKVAAKEKTATMTGELKPSVVESAVVGAGGFWLMEMGDDEGEVEHGAAGDVAPPAKEPVLPPAPERAPEKGPGK